MHVVDPPASEVRVCGIEKAERSQINKSREQFFLCGEQVIKREDIFILHSKMDKYRCTEWTHNALIIGIYLTIN